MKKVINKVITHPLFSGSMVMVFGSNSASALNYLYHFIVIKLLKDPALYGELVSLISLIGLLGILPSAFNLVIVKEISSTKAADQINNLVNWFREKMFFYSLVFALIVLIFSPFISSFLNISKTSSVASIAILTLFTLQAGFNRSILQGLLRFKDFVVSLLFENIVKLILTIVLIYIGLQVQGALFALLISAFFGWQLTNSYLKYKKNQNKFSPNVRSMFRFAVPVVLQTAATTSLYTTDVILVKHFFTAHQAGIYASLSVLGKIIFFATGPISSVMFPLVSKRKSTGEPFKRIFVYSFIMTFVFCSLSLVLYGLFPEFIIRLLYRPEYLEGKNLVVWFGAFISLFTLSSILINYNLSINRTKVTIFPLIASLAQIILIVVFHQTLFTVIIISTLVAALLLITLLIYSSYEPKISV